MNRIAFLLFSFLILALAREDFQSARKSSLKATTARALEGFVTKSGNITLQKDDNGFYAYVDFAYHYSDASDDTIYDPSLGIVGIALYSSDTILTRSCLDFNEYLCSLYECYTYSWVSTPSYPYFTVDQGYLANTHLYLDYSSWSLSTAHDYATIALTCESNASSTYGSSRYGMIGLGMNGTSANFLAGTPFTVSVNSFASTANLLFGSDDVKKSESYYSGTFSTNSNWHISAKDSSYILVGDYYSTKFNGNVIFDLDADAIGFPLKFYTSLILALNDKNGLSCNSENYKPFCQFNGKLTDLPVISIELGTQKIEIPPPLYVENVNLSEDPNNIYLENVYLNLKAINSSLTDQSYVTPAYDNYIILDQNFLNYYFAEFTADTSSKNYSISLYTPYKYNPSHPHHEAIWPFIVGGVLGVCLIVGIICCIVRACKRRAQANTKVFQSGSNQAPLVVNDQNVNNYPNYDRDVYGSHQQSQNYWNAHVYSNYQQPGPYAGYPNYPQQGFYNGQPQTYRNSTGYLPQGTVPTQQATQ